MSLAKTAEKGWAEIALDGWLLGIEASMVIGLRVTRIACGGPEGCREARLMVSEKIDSGMHMSGALLSGRLGATPKAVLGNAVAHYLDGVRANRRRLLSN